LRSRQSKRKISFHSTPTFMIQAKSIAANPLRQNQPDQRPSTKAVGDGGEQIALDYLSARGLLLEARNFKTPGRGGGEIDLIMRAPDGTLVFVEVRQRKNANHGGAAASVSALKRTRIVFAARHYLSRLRSVPPCRFDVLSLQGQGEALQVQWLQAAFDAA
jgi:putative endonuclease